MIELLLGLVIILAFAIGIAELCRRKLTWPKGHPGATYGITFFLVFLFLAWIGNMDEIEEQGIETPAPGLAEQGIETPAPGQARRESETPALDPSERDLDNKAQALDQAFKRERENKAPAKGGLFANLTAGLAKLEAIENMGEQPASKAFERELDPLIAGMNCGEMVLLLDQVADEALIARRDNYTAWRKWKQAKRQARATAETDDAAWARIENMKPAGDELNPQWKYKFEKAAWLADAMSAKGCCDDDPTRSCRFFPGPYSSGQPLELFSTRREKERRKWERQAAFEREHGPAVVDLNCGEMKLYLRQKGYQFTSLGGVFGNAINAAERQLLQNIFICKGCYGETSADQAFGICQRLKTETFPQWRVWRDQTLDTWSGEVYQQ